MELDFTSAISHEFKKPLGIIKDVLSQLHSEKTDLLNKDQQLETAINNLDDLSTLVKDLLDLSTIERGQMPFHLEEVSISAVVTEVIKDFQSQAAQKSLSLVAALPENLQTAYADPKQLKEILYSLLNNTIKSVPKAGRITLTGIKVKEVLVLSVSDTGLGLSMDDQRSIFDRFFQQKNTVNQAIQGSSLWFSLTKKRVEGNGGEMIVESQSGKGNCFSFTLPVFTPKEQEKVTLNTTFSKLCQAPVISLLAIEFNHKKMGYEESLSEQMGEPCFEELKSILRILLPRSSDLLIPQPSLGRLMIILNGTSKSGAKVVKSKLKMELAQNERLQPSPILLGPVTCPEDGNSAIDLISQLNQITPKP